MKVCIVVGTRPEIIKMSPIIRECVKGDIDFFILHTGQHYSYKLDKIFFEELRIPEPKYNLKVGSGSHGEETGKILIGTEKVLLKERVKITLVEGDTNSVLAGALASIKIGVKVGHVEAGLRSRDRKMPEEINRILVDHISDLLFAPTEIAEENLVKEGIERKHIYVTGNTIVDAVQQNLRIANEKSNILEKLSLRKEKYGVVTVHRQENVDKKRRFIDILKGLEEVYRETGLELIYPIHPRARKMIKKFRLELPKGIRMIEPLGYLDFLKLEANAKIVLTDSGGVQEETCILGVPCVTLRDNTERPETIRVGSNILTGTNPYTILKGVLEMLRRKRGEWENPFGDGRAGKRIFEIVRREIE